MGWILIPLATAGIAGLSGGNDDCGYDACAVQSCAPVAQYAPAAPSYGYGQRGYAASGSYGGPQGSYGAQATYNGADFSSGASSY